MAKSESAKVLVVAHRTAPTPALIEAVRERAARGDARFHLLVPNLADHAEITESERHRRKEEAEHMLALALPLFDEATGTHTEGSTSGRHDPIDAIEEKLHDEHFDEIIVSTLPHSLSRRLHLDLAHRLEHLGLPVTTVTAVGRE
jgi:hypothetical protein